MSTEMKVALCSMETQCPRKVGIGRQPLLLQDGAHYLFLLLPDTGIHAYSNLPQPSELWLGSGGFSEAYKGCMQLPQNASFSPPPNYFQFLWKTGGDACMHL